MWAPHANGSKRAENLRSLGQVRMERVKKEKNDEVAAFWLNLSTIICDRVEEGSDNILKEGGWGDSILSHRLLSFRETMGDGNKRGETLCDPKSRGRKSLAPFELRGKGGKIGMQWQNGLSVPGDLRRGRRVWSGGTIASSGGDLRKGRRGNSRVSYLLSMGGTRKGVGR